MIITEPSTVIAGWIGGKTGVAFKPPFTTIAYVRDGKIKAAALFNIWQKYDIECSVAVDDFAPRSLIKACREYAEQLGCTRITFRTRDSNHKAQNALEKLGAYQEGRIREFFGDEDCLIYGLILKETPFGTK